MDKQHPPASGTPRGFAPRLPEGMGRLLLAALLVAVVVGMRPLAFFLQASQEVSLRPGDVVQYALRLFVFVLVPLLVLAAVLLLPRARFLRVPATALLLAAAVALWIQGYFLVWDYGALDGKPLNFAAYTWHGVGEVLAWAGIFGLFLWQRQRAAAAAKGIFLVVAATIGFGAAAAYANLPPEPWHKRYDVKMDTYYTFSKTKNVLFLVFDATRSDVFGEIFAGMTPAEKSLFDGFTFFRNTTGSFNATNPAVSGFLTGEPYDHAEDSVVAFSRMFTSGTSVPAALKKAGYVSEVYPYNMGSVHITPANVDNLLDKGWASGPGSERTVERELAKLRLVARFNFTPHFLKTVLFDASEMYATSMPQAARAASRPAPSAAAPSAAADEAARADDALPPALATHVDWDRQRIEAFATRMTFREEPVFKYLHFHGGHTPFIHDETYAGRRMPLNLDSYARQYKGSVLHFTRAIVDSLKKAGVYDNTMLVILGDHGVHVPQPGEDVDVQQMVSEWLRPLLLVKPFGPAAAPLKTSSAPVSLFDVPATVFEATGLEYPGQARSAFRVPEDARRVRETYARIPGKDNASEFQSGAFIYTVDGNVHDPAAWKRQPALLLAGKGRVPVRLEDMDETLTALRKHLGDTSRHIIKDPKP